MHFEDKIDKSKRKLLGKLFLLFSIYNLKISGLFSEDNSYILKGPLAGSVYYTKEKPGKWETLVDSHLPQITKKENLIEISTFHEMRGYDHYILKHVVLDNKLSIISEKTFDPSKDTPTSYHNVAGYSEKVYVLSVCNKHDTWLNYINI